MNCNSKTISLIAFINAFHLIARFFISIHCLEESEGDEAQDTYTCWNEFGKIEMHRLTGIFPARVAAEECSDVTPNQGIFVLFVGESLQNETVCVEENVQNWTREVREDNEISCFDAETEQWTVERMVEHYVEVDLKLSKWRVGQKLVFTSKIIHSFPNILFFNLLIVYNFGTELNEFEHGSDLSSIIKEHTGRELKAIKFYLKLEQVVILSKTGSDVNGKFMAHFEL